MGEELQFVLLRILRSGKGKGKGKGNVWIGLVFYVLRLLLMSIIFTFFSELYLEEKDLDVDVAGKRVLIEEMVEKKSLNEIRKIKSSA